MTGSPATIVTTQFAPGERVAEQGSGLGAFYSTSPSGFDVEFGFGGRLIDESTWVVSEITKPSLWGHRTPQPTS